MANNKTRASLVDIPVRFAVKKQTTEGILSYDLDNAYPQRVMDIINGSGVATRCNDLLADYINGQGFADKTFYKAVINPTGQTNDYLLRKVAADLAMFRGFALHVNYDANGKVISVAHVPFEHCRLAIEKDAHIPYAVAVYYDWDKRVNRIIKKENIDFINFYNPDKAVAEAGEDWAGYKGQIFYYSADGNREYPKATTDPVLEDCVTDFEVKTFKYKNIVTGLMASHVVHYPGEFEDDQARSEFKGALKGFQGAENTSKMILLETPAGTEPIKFDKLDIQDNDRLFEYTETSIQDNIRMCYGMSSILIGKEVAGKLGSASEEIEATESYNKKTAGKRLVVEEVFKDIFTRFNVSINPTNDYSIIPITATAENVDSQNLAAVIGVGGVTAMTQIIADVTLTPQQKVNSIVVIFGVEKASAEAMVLGTPLTE